ncbi:MAG: plastocyanin/azurin family copper-binding protein [Candidatus Nitrosocaldaceae archaeon]
MTTESKNLIIKSSGRRTAKGIAIILIVMVVGAAISLAYKDVWSKYPPLRVLNQKQQPQTPVETIPTGEKRTFNLVFKESEDFTQLWFEMDGVKNPDIEVSLGDEITINIVNSGLMPHAFGVVSDPNDVNSVIFNSAIGSANKPLLSNNSASTTFTADKPGEYYYICLVPGHALQGMKGKFIVE